jgi:rSAM/selenodomain-associated transferase 2
VRISVVIPTLSEEATIARAIASARATLGDCELIVVDGGSPDATVALAKGAGAEVLVQSGPRAVAMNAGVARAGGEALLFLHADTELPDGAGDAIREALRAADGGAFRLGFDERPPGWRTLSRVYARTSRVAYGDQAIFCSRAAFERLGGYRPMPIMEDYDLVKRLQRHGRFVLLPHAVRSSSRRHRRHGELRTISRIAVIKVLYRLGASPSLLARAYKPAR